MPEREFNQIFSERLRYYLNKYEMTQLELSKRLGVGTTSVYNWCNGIKTPRIDKVDAMCNVFNCRRSDLMEDAKEIPPCDSCRTGAAINVYGRITAGIPIEIAENIIDTEEITEEMAAEGEYFALQIRGDSMKPRMAEGDIVIVRAQKDAESGDIVIATVNGTDAICKRLKKYSDGIALISINPAYEPMYFSNREVSEKPVCILGRVVELRVKF